MFNDESRCGTCRQHSHLSYSIACMTSSSRSRSLTSLDSGVCRASYSCGNEYSSRIDTGAIRQDQRTSHNDQIRSRACRFDSPPSICVMKDCIASSSSCIRKGASAQSVDTIQMERWYEWGAHLMLEVRIHAFNRCDITDMCLGEIVHKSHLKRKRKTIINHLVPPPRHVSGRL